MPPDQTEAAGPPQPETPPAPGNLWNDFLRRSLLLAGFAGTARMRGQEPPAEEPPAQPGTA